MYQDEALILVGAVATGLIVLLALYLISSRKKARLYREILGAETKAMESLTSTINTTEGVSAPNIKATDAKFDIAALKGQYDIMAEVSGGGMSRVFIAKKTNIGNDWIVKYVPAAIGKLTNEADILKSLNHISLPKIIDIFDDDSGLYIVQSYVEGMGLNHVLRANGVLHEFMVLDFAKQLAQVLKYLHERGPILHLDLKPSNIMVTHDTKLVLIDFGISKMQDDDSKVIGVTESYAAPEQLPRGLKGKFMLRRRFGENAEFEKKIDVRTDIFSFGAIMYEAAVGHVPTVDNMDKLKSKASPGLCEIILKCLETSQKNRFQSADELLRAIVNLSAEAKPAMTKTLFVRRLSKFAAAVFAVVAVAGFATGITTRRDEHMAAMSITPEMLTVSVGAQAGILVERTMPNGSSYYIDPARLYWEGAGIAVVEYGSVLGLEPGWTQIRGLYRGAEVVLNVHVVWPIDLYVDVSARYEADVYVHLFAGSANRERIDGGFGTMEFVSPESVAISEGGAMYFSDAGVLRRLYQGFSETININPPFLRPAIVRTYGNDVYILTSPWQDGDDFFYGIIRLRGNEAEGFFLGSAIGTQVRDFYVHDGKIYFLEQSSGVTHLRTINVEDADDVNTIVQLPETVSSIAIGGEVFFADDALGVILAYRDGELAHIAGAAGDRGFVDGAEPRFYRPTRIRYQDGALYVWDFNVLRRVQLENGAAYETTTIAGVPSADYDMEFYEEEPAWQIVFPFSYLADFVHLDDGILVTDPVRGVLWRVG